MTRGQGPGASGQNFRPATGHRSLATGPPISILILALCLVSTPAQAQKSGYLTEDELDLVRDAQEIERRVPVYIRLAEKRLIALGVLQPKPEDKPKKPKDSKNEKPAAGKKDKDKDKEEDEDAYLKDFSRAQLLRGYAQALEEIMWNLDDGYERKLDIRTPLEEFEKFIRETLPLLEKLKASTPAEASAREVSLAKARQAHEDARAALKIVPKTEKKKKQ